MRNFKLAILAIAVLLQVHSGAGDLLGQAAQSAPTARTAQTSQATQTPPQSPQAEAITRQETLRGSVTPEREWWDVLHYHLQVEFLLETRRLRGSNTITFKALKPKKNAD